MVTFISYIVTKAFNNSSIFKICPFVVKHCYLYNADTLLSKQFSTFKNICTIHVTYKQDVLLLRETVCGNRLGSWNKAFRQVDLGLHRHTNNWG